MLQVPYAPAVQSPSSVHNNDASMTDTQLLTTPSPFSTTTNSTLPTILCCLCGTRIQSNPSNMCLNCLKSQVDITADIPKQLTLFYCRNCNRYQRPPWVTVNLESAEMMAMCLKKIKGLSKDVRLTDAVFIWTEPHSRRIKIKLTIQKEVFSNAILQQSFIVEFIVTGMQCTDCQKSFTEHTWTSVVQVRQKVAHKKTMLMLEQLMLKHGIALNSQGVKAQPDGLDFYWGNRGGAKHLLEFLRSVVPIKSKESKRLISQDDNSNIYNYKYTLYAEIAPVCKDDLVLLTPSLCAMYGHCSPLQLVTRITAQITLIDPITLRTAEISAGTYWHYPFRAILTTKHLTEYIVVDTEDMSTNEYNNNSNNINDNNARGFSKASIPLNQKISPVRLTLAKSSDMGLNDKMITAVSHLGNIVHTGDSVMCYDVHSVNIEDEMEEQQSHFKTTSLPDIIVVKKAYTKKNRDRKRQFVIKTLIKEESDEVMMTNSNNGRRNERGDMKRNAMDMEEFLQEIEEDKELQGKVNLYRRPVAQRRASTSSIAMSDHTTGGDDDGVAEFPEVDMSQLLENMGSLTVSVAGANADGATNESDVDDGGALDNGESESAWEADGTKVGATPTTTSSASGASAKKSGGDKNDNRAKRKGRQ